MQGNILQQLGTADGVALVGGCRPLALTCRRLRLDANLAKSIPLIAGWTLAYPFCRLMTAILTYVCYLVFCHLQAAKLHIFFEKKVIRPKKFISPA
jgi:hypothetical protein